MARLGSLAVGRGSGFSLFPFLAGGEKCPLRGREVGVGSMRPFHRLREPDTAIQLAVGSLEAVPTVGRRGEVAEDALTFDVVVQPLTQSGPGPDQRLVGQLDNAFVAGHETGLYQ